MRGLLATKPNQKNRKEIPQFSGRRSPPLGCTARERKKHYTDTDIYWICTEGLIIVVHEIIKCIFSAEFCSNIFEKRIDNLEKKKQISSLVCSRFSFLMILGLLKRLTSFFLHVLRTRDRNVSKNIHEIIIDDM